MRTSFIAAAFASCTKDLAVLARKPAPIQVDYGGIDTNGMSQIAYRLADEVLDPPDLPKRYVEELVYLPGGVLSLRPPIYSPLVGPLPAQRNGYLTFGSFNNNAKINAMVLDLWAGVLRAMDRSRLILKFPSSSDAGVCAYYLHQLARRGVSQERVTIYGLLSDYAHLDLYNQIDLVLDTYPYNGCMVACIPASRRTSSSWTCRATGPSATTWVGTRWS